MTVRVDLEEEWDIWDKPHWWNLRWQYVGTQPSQAEASSYAHQWYRRERPFRIKIKRTPMSCVEIDNRD